MNKSIYAIALAATTTLTFPPIIASESVGTSDIYSNVNFVTSKESTTSNQIADNRRYLNSIMIKKSFYERLEEKRHQMNLSNQTEKLFYSICEKCSYFDIKEVYADYSPASNAIRIDMIIDNDFLLIVRKNINDYDEDNCVAVSLSKGNERYIADYLDLNNLTKEVNYCIKG